jgi:hypothetical protein
LITLAATSLARTSPLKTALIAPFVELWIKVMVLLYQIVRFFRFAKEQTLIRQIHSGVNNLFHLPVNTTGVLWADTPTICVSNHVSCMDVFALGAAGFVVYGGWGSWVNMSHGTQMGAVAGLIQGGYSFVLTFCMTIVMAYLMRMLVGLSSLDMMQDAATASAEKRAGK